MDTFNPVQVVGNTAVKLNHSRFHAHSDSGAVSESNGAVKKARYNHLRAVDSQRLVGNANRNFQIVRPDRPNSQENRSKIRMRENVSAQLRLVPNSRDEVTKNIAGAVKKPAVSSVIVHGGSSFRPHYGSKNVGISPVRMRQKGILSAPRQISAAAAFPNSFGEVLTKAIFLAFSLVFYLSLSVLECQL
ncbi:hypothetical protein RQN30_02695 [Arcanobacterium hippocoleae]